MRARVSTALFATLAILGMLMGTLTPAHAQGTATVSNLSETWHTTYPGEFNIFDQTSFTFAWNVPYRHIPSWTIYVHITWVDKDNNKTDTNDLTLTQRGYSYGVSSVNLTVSTEPYTGVYGSGGGFLDNAFPYGDMNSFDNVVVYWHYTVKTYIDGVYTGSSVTTADSTHYDWNSGFTAPYIGNTYW